MKAQNSHRPWVRPFAGSTPCAKPRALARAPAAAAPVAPPISWVVGTAAEARDYEDFVRRRVETARSERQTGLSFSNEEVEAEFSARRADLLRKADEAER